MDKTQVAAELGMGLDEVLDVVDTADGVVAHLIDDTKMIRSESGWMFLVPPNEKYEGTFPVYPAGAALAKDLEAAGDLDDLEARTGSPEALRDGETDKFATPGELESTASALVTEPGPPAEGAMVEPEGPTGTVAGSAAAAVRDAEAQAKSSTPGIAAPTNPEAKAAAKLASAANDETGARNIADAANPADPGTSVPDGPAHLVLAWVGNDSTRAAQALGAERSKDKPRSSLVRDLEALAGEPTRRTES